MGTKTTAVSPSPTTMDPTTATTPMNLKTTGATMEFMPALCYDWLINVMTCGSEKKFRHEILSIVDIQVGDYVLDVGCGTGELAILASNEYAKTSGKVIGIDATPSMIHRAQWKQKKQQNNNNNNNTNKCWSSLWNPYTTASDEKYDNNVNDNTANGHLQFMEGLAESLPMDDNTFNVVMSSFALHHLPEQELKERALAEMKRVLVPGGKIFIVDFPNGFHGTVQVPQNEDHGHDHHHHGHHHHHHFSSCLKQHYQFCNNDDDNDDDEKEEKVDPLVSLIQANGFEDIIQQKVEMFGAIAVLARKP